MERRLWNGIWVTELRDGDGASALIADHGAHLVSWIPAGGAEALFLSTRSRYGKSEAIRGGVPIIFPQFNRRGDGIRHGFARLAEWQPVFAGIEAGRACARYALTQAAVEGFGWNHPFSALYEVALRGKSISLSLTVQNLSEQSWAFTAALHTYLGVEDIAAVRVSGLEGTSGTNFANGAADKAVQEGGFLQSAEAVDYVFADIARPIRVHDKKRIFVSSQQGFRDAVVWNPGDELEQTIGDLTPGSNRSFLCVEAATVEQPVALAPGERWAGVQILTVEESV